MRASCSPAARCSRREPRGRPHEVLRVTSVRIPAAVLQTFVDELDERVADMERDLLALERPAADSVHAEEVRSLFRAAHSLKGAARAIGLPEIETVCHELESRLAPVRSSGGTPDASLIE